MHAVVREVETMGMELARDRLIDLARVQFGYARATGEGGRALAAYWTPLRRVSKNAGAPRFALCDRSAASNLISNGGISPTPRRSEPPCLARRGSD